MLCRNARASSTRCRYRSRRVSSSRAREAMRAEGLGPGVDRDKREIVGDRDKLKAFSTTSSRIRLSLRQVRAQA